jgi:hypothetical protein
MTLKLNGIELKGCNKVERRHNGPAFSENVGGQGDVEVMRQNDVGKLIAHFDQGSPGQAQMSEVSSEHSHELSVEGDDGGPDFTSHAWLDPDRSHGTTWVFTVTLPR